ncbi:unnamed protein product [Cuscuta epithymum]|uniref:Uncharacterized protein n=1 Tax=Cuscuta epithymum TaxID=186058 RepID=A0AAV0GK91_9ASTE|nr:unnamed protein product [Cuscuta epithymum]
MAKNVGLVISTLCFLAFASVIHCVPQKFNVEGKVYCDTCRVQFETRISQDLPGAIVQLNCRNIDNRTLTYSVQGVTEAGGRYSLTVEGDHEKDICDVTVVKSPREDCKETVAGLEKARVICTSNVGIQGSTRHANPLFFMKDKADAECPKVMQEIAYIPEEGSDFHV